MMSIAVVIPTRGAWDYAALAVESAGKCTPGALVVVVDDASPDWPGERIVRGWLPSDVPFVIMRYDRQAGLSRSWNMGASIAREYGAEFVCFGNSDLVFPDGWADPLVRAAERFTVAGPVTNAPGHSSGQAVENYLPSYVVDDDPDLIGETIRALPVSPPVASRRLNGFCLFARVDEVYKVADRGNVFDSAIPMDGNEDDLLRRAWAKGRGACICPDSFVFHYRSASRGLHKKGLDKGAFRLEGCGSCGKKHTSLRT